MTDSSLMISVPANTGYGQVVHLPVLSGDMVAEGDCLVTVKTDLDYFTLRAPAAGRVLTLVRNGQDVTSEEPLIILQTEESLIADAAAQAAARAKPAERARPVFGAERAITAEARPAPLAAEIPDHAEAEARRAAVRSEIEATAQGAPRRYRPKARPVTAAGVTLLPSRGGAIDTALRIVLGVALYVAAAFMVLPDLAAEALDMGAARQSVVFTAFALTAAGIWAALGMRGSPVASRSVALISAALVAVSGLTVYGGLGALPAQRLAAHELAAAQAPARAMAVETTAPEQADPLATRFAPAFLDEDVARRMDLGPNLHGAVNAAIQHQRETRMVISRPQMPIYRLTASTTLPRDLPKALARPQVAPPPRAARVPAEVRLRREDTGPSLPGQAASGLAARPSLMAGLDGSSRLDTASHPRPGPALAVLNPRHLSDSAGPALSRQPVSRQVIAN